MKRLIWIKLGGRDVHLPKLIGVFLLVFAALMFVQAVALMVDSWDAIQNFNRCSEVDSAACGEALYRITGVSIWAGQTQLSTAEFWAALLGPIAMVFGWLIVLLIGVIIYKSGALVLPIEEDIQEMPSSPRRIKK